MRQLRFSPMEIDWRALLPSLSLGEFLTAFSYLIASIACLKASILPRISQRERHAWKGLALASAFLTIDEMFHLLPLLSELGRAAALQQGWYGERRSFQTDLIIAAGAASALTLSAVALWLRSASAECWVAILSIAALATFILVRTVSLHSVDVLLYRVVMGSVHVNRLFELSLTAIATLAALSALVRARRRENGHFL